MRSARRWMFAAGLIALVACGASAARLATPNDAGPSDARTSTIDAAIPDGAIADAGTSIDAAPSIGAKVPFTTIEAEDPANTTNGKSVRLGPLPSANDSSPEVEASGRAFVELDATGDYVQFTNEAAANTIVVRHCIPDAPAGGGITATLSLYVNGSKRQALALNSVHNWLYGTAGANGQSNDPDAGVPHVYWDETRYFVQGEALKQGDAVRLQKDEGDSAAFYRIDLVDLEQAPPASSPPAVGTYLDVTTYGADPTGVNDSSSAITMALADAKTQAKSVWIPAGTFTLVGSIDIDSVAVIGAGMWWTSLVRKVQLPRSPATMGHVIGIRGTGAGLSDVFVDSNQVSRAPVDGDDYGILGRADGWTIENVWLTHTGTGTWLSGNTGAIRNCRVRFTYADGLNSNNGVTNVVVENNHVRGTGDDGLAILSQNTYPLSANVTLRNNTVSAPWWGAPIDVAGGDGHVIANNFVADSTLDACLVLNLTRSYPMLPLTNATLHDNVMVRCGGNGNGGQKRGAVWIFPDSTTIDTTLFQNNTVIAPLFDGFQIVGGMSQKITFDRNLVEMEDGGLDGFRVVSGVVGSGTFTNNSVTGVASGDVAFTNATDGGYTVTSSGNSW